MDNLYLELQVQESSLEIALGLHEAPPARQQLARETIARMEHLRGKHEL